MNYGIQTGISHKDYLAVDAVSASLLKKGRKSMQHLKIALDKPDPPNESMNLGSVVHALVLEHESVVKNKFYIYPKCDRRTAAGKKTYALAQLDADGKDIVSDDMLAEAKIMAANVKAHPMASKLLEGSQTELSCFWHNDEHDLDCKCRPDIINSKGIPVDLKTCSDASFFQFRTDAYNFGYHLQAAHYLEGVRSHVPEANNFVFICVENKEPYTVAVYAYNDASLEVANKDRNFIMHQYKECLNSGIWTGYGDSIEDLDLPPWAY